MGRRAFRLVSGLAAVAMVLSFQNCGKAGFDGADQSSDSLTDSASETKLNFAYDATFDQITYSSCFGESLAGQPGFFTLLAGAYDTGGVTIPQSYKDDLKTSGLIKPVYPSKVVTDEQIKIAIANASENVEAVPQMALRTRSNVQQIRTPNAQTATPFADYVDMLGDLTDDRWLDPLIRGTSPLTFFNYAETGRRNLEASLAYNTDEGMAQGLRNDLRLAGMLGLTFKAKTADGFDATVARASTYTDLRRAYGRGYTMTFESVVAPYTQFYYPGTTPNAHMWNPNNFLTQIQEINLREPDKGSGATWTCSANRRYLIVRREDMTDFCPPDPFSFYELGFQISSGGTPILTVTAEQYRREYEVVRRHLKPEYWDVSVAYRCAVPKERGCYKAEVLNGQTVGIEYDQTQPCFQNLPDMPYGASIPIKRCAQYVSICNRN